MKTCGALFLNLLLLLYGMPLTAQGQNGPDVFALPDGVMGEAYRANIVALLRDTYHLRLESSARASVFRWTLAAGEVPSGLILRPNGTIAGTPRVARTEPYRFQLKVVDLSVPKADALSVDFTVRIASPRIRLAHVNAPKLVPVRLTEPQTATNDSANNLQRANDSQSLSSRTNKKWTPDNIYTSMLRDNNDTELPTETRKTSSAAVAPALVTVSCTQQCDPSPAPDPSKDFIIDAVTGATSGKTRFKRGDRARIIIKNKNPFLYEYRVTIEEQVVDEPGLAAFLELLPIGKGTFPDAKASDKNAVATARQSEKDLAPNATPDCPWLSTLLSAEQSLSSAEGALKPSLAALTDAFNVTQATHTELKAALKTPGAQCPGLCSDANTLLGTLRSYLTTTKDTFERFTKEVAKFEERAKAFNTNVTDLEANNSKCAGEIGKARLIALAEHYLEVAEKLKEGLNKLTEGRKGFETAAKSIEKVFATANAFYEVREVGDFDLPTNVKIKLERKEIAQEKAEFAKYVDTKLNFGGGARFTLAGGLVAALLEKPEYERVSTVVNGQVVNIVGLKRTSSSRLLPLLMLHSRLYDTRKRFIDGIHFSVGLTAKPNSEGTSAEFLIGPSLSLIEGRMFFTAGGYLGKKPELQGSFVLGSQIPANFGDELPISEHYVWKPGFAITYKIK